MSLKSLKLKVRDIPDFPKKGVLFRDITPLLKDSESLREIIRRMAETVKKQKPDLVVGIESRGFIFGAALAYKLGAGFVPVRKKGKLPYKTKSVTYQLEYGTDTLEIHEDAFKPNVRVLIVDDLLATGGTVKAVIDLILSQKAKIVGVAFLVELKFLKGKERLKNLPIYSIIQY